MIKYLFSDLDGTLLNPAGTVSQANVDALRQAGLPITLVSARAPIEMLGAVRALDLTGPQIAFNGGLIFDYREGQIIPLQTAPLTRQRAATLLKLIQTEFPAVSLSCYTRDHWYVQKMDRGVRAESQLTGQTPTVTNYADLLATGDHQIFKIMIMTLDNALMQRLASTLKRRADPDISVKLSGKTYLEITSQAAQKSRGIAYIMDTCHLKAADTAAFGDGENDLPMLKAVGTPIVMGNATPDIQAAGRFVTKTNAEDGVAYAVQHFLGGESR
ncbi:HAD family phosphatase [Lactiplantibacillus garii]|uniref:HAD family phosphatase n=1 Tax=Lactiplantibacillus garii TaxID=2306423 RepID=A0A3R8J764_9LACO|nr:Cof-type HAD-IIB family hydrolase [Lactiplantibacillus garii]RRK10567.1 HAD family phosphatase [Lactiplantibacillus garii]